LEGCFISISNHYFPVIPACLESFLKKDAGQAGMTESEIPGVQSLDYNIVFDYIFHMIRTFKKEEFPI